MQLLPVNPGRPWRNTAGAVSYLSEGAAACCVLVLRAYQRWISPLLPSACRFYPTCSEYAIEAIEKHGAVRGVGLGIRRLLRCHPFHPGGFDPVR